MITPFTADGRVDYEALGRMIDYVIEGTLTITIDGKTYFMNESGAMVEGWYKVQDNWYYFYPGQGQKAVNTSISGFQLDANGVWQH